MNTAFGHIAEMTQELGEELSPLQKEMENITKVVTIIAMAFGIVFFFIAYFCQTIQL